MFSLFLCWPIFVITTSVFSAVIYFSTLMSYNTFHKCHIIMMANLFYIGWLYYSCIRVWEVDKWGLIDQFFKSKSFCPVIINIIWQNEVWYLTRNCPVSFISWELNVMLHSDFLASLRLISIIIFASRFWITQTHLNQLNHLSLPKSYAICRCVWVRADSQGSCFHYSPQAHTPTSYFKI